MASNGEQVTTASDASEEADSSMSTKSKRKIAGEDQGSLAGGDTPGPSGHSDDQESESTVKKTKLDEEKKVLDDKDNDDHEENSNNTTDSEPTDDKDPTQKLEESFDIRRQFIVLEEPTISMVKETYPELFTGKQLALEFQRVSGIDMDEAIREYFAKYAKGILEISRGMSGSGAVLRRAELAKQESSTLVQYWDMVSALCLIPLLLHENLADMVQEVDNNQESIDTQEKVVPMLICRGSIFSSDEFFLLAEKELVQEFEEFTLAFAGLFSTYWVFNMEYPKSLINTYSFIQKGILNLKDEYSTPLPAKQLNGKLQRWARHSLQD